MQVIIDFFKGFADVATSLVDFVISTVQDIVYVVRLTAQTVLQIPNYFAWLPGELVAIIVTIFAIVVIYKILGREG